MAPTSSMSRDRFLQSYHLRFEKEFKHNGREAEWAPSAGGPKTWGDEDAIIELPADATRLPTLALAISPDQEYLAIVVNMTIKLYHAASRKQVAELAGHSTRVWNLEFAPLTRRDSKSLESDDGRPREAAYLLLSVGDVNDDSGAPMHILLWYLDEHAQPLERSMPFALNNLADQALRGVERDLRLHHDLTDMELRSIRKGLEGVLKAADIRHRAVGLPHVGDGFPSYVASVVSPDHTAMLYLSHNDSTQDVDRPLDQLPQVVVYDLASRAERCRLKGHRDTIIWAAWSPDPCCARIATACWDGTYGIWNARTGERLHAVRPTHGQNWSGAWSPDGKHVLLSGGQPTRVAVYEAATGQEVARMDLASKKLRNPGGGWVRQIAWHPDDSNLVAMVIGQAVALWQPFTTTSSASATVMFEDDVDREKGVLAKGRQDVVFELKNDGTMLDRFCSLATLKWLDGAKLAVQTSEDTTLVWDREKGTKWRFQRPLGKALVTQSNDVVLLDGGKVLVTVNGDWKVRFWKLSFL